MKQAALMLCLVATAGLWGWALLWPKPAEPLPDRYCGEFVLYRFEPPEGVVMANPFPPGQERRYTFRPEGTWSLKVLVAKGYEMFRQEGILLLEPDGTLSMEQVSENRKETHKQPDRYRPEWSVDAKGKPILKLTHKDQGYEFYLRPIQ